MKWAAALNEGMNAPLSSLAISQSHLRFDSITSVDRRRDDAQLWYRGAFFLKAPKFLENRIFGSILSQNTEHLPI